MDNIPAPSRTTRWRMKKRGGEWNPNYHRRGITTPSLAAWAAIGGYQEVRALATGVWKTRLAPYFTSERKDLAQEIAARLWELSGHARFSGRAWRWTVAVNVQRDWLDKLHWQRELPFSMLPADYSRTLEFEDAAIVLEQVRKLAGPQLYRRALSGDRAAVKSIRGIVWSSK